MPEEVVAEMVNPLHVIAGLLLCAVSACAIVFGLGFVIYALQGDQEGTVRNAEYFGIMLSFLVGWACGRWGERV